MLSFFDDLPLIFLGVSFSDLFVPGCGSGPRLGSECLRGAVGLRRSGPQLDGLFNDLVLGRFPSLRCHGRSSVDEVDLELKGGSAMLF